MLDKHEISIACLTNYIGFLLGFALMALAEFMDADHIGRWGLAVICVACTYSVQRSLKTRDDRLRQAFELGRDHENGQSLTAVR